MEIYKLFSVHVVRYFIYKRVEIEIPNVYWLFFQLSQTRYLYPNIYSSQRIFFFQLINMCKTFYIRSILFSPLCVVVIKRETWKKYESYAYDLITCNIGSRHFLPMRCALVSIKKWRKNIHVCMKSFS